MTTKLTTERETELAERARQDMLANVGIDPPMPLETVLHWIAQGAINIDEGHTVIEAGSRVHRAMHRLCDLAQRGELHYTP